MNYVSGVAHSRHEYIDDLVRETHTNLETNPGVLKHMDGAMRLGALATLNNVTIPNVRHGVASLSRSQQLSGSLPIIAATRTEPLFLGDGFGGMNETQKKAVRATTEPLYFSRHLEAMQKLLKHEEGQFNINRGIHEMNLGAYVLNVFAQAKFQFTPKNLNHGSSETHRLISGRPVVVLLANREGKFVHRASNTGALVHEVVHVEQQERDPLRPVLTDDESVLKAELATELEAYHHAGMYERGLFESDDERYAGNNDVYGSAYIESRRRRYANPDRPYEPEQEFIEWLIEMGAIGNSLTVTAD